MGVEEVLARTAARRAAGANQFYPRHARGGAAAQGATRGAAAPRKSLTVLPECRHGGTDADILERCPSCNGGARHVRECEIHTRCTWEPVNPAVMDCRRCRAAGLGYEPPPYARITTRHLLYHVYPRVGSRWRERLLRLREHLHVFNGIRAVAVATDRTTDGVNLVAEALAGTGCELVPIPNDPSLREVASFLPLFERAARFTDPGHVTLYGQAKGSTRPNHPTVHRWVEVLEEVMLGHWGAVEEVLSSRPVAGCFLKLGRGWPDHESRSDWHFSGSWYAFRNAELFSRPDWRRIDRTWTGIEPYPSLHFAPEQAGCVFHGPRPTPAMNLYGEAYWSRAVEPELASWRLANADKRTPAPAAAHFGLLPPAAWRHVFGPLAGKRVGYVPTPGNCGDKLIEVGALRLLQHYGVRWTIGCDPSADVLLVAGGGSMGAAHYGLCREARGRALACGPPVWVLPQTYFAPDPEQSRYARTFARDETSLRLAPGAELAPDLALAAPVTAADAASATGVGVFLRRDIEGLFGDSHPSDGDPTESCSDGWQLLELAARYAEIVTDRRHMAIAGLLAGRRVTLLPNWNHANRGLWEYSLKGLGCQWRDSP